MRAMSFGSAMVVLGYWMPRIEPYRQGRKAKTGETTGIYISRHTCDTAVIDF